MNIYIIEASVGLLVVGVLYLALYRNSTQIGLRRAVILTGLAASLLFPLINIELFAGQSQVLGSLSFMQLEAIDVTPTTQEWSIGLKDIGIAIYFGISGFLAFSFLRQIYILSSLYKKEPIEKDGRFRIYNSDKSHSFSFFQFIVLGRDVSLSDEERERILEHEKYHSRNWHSIDLIVFELLRILFWFHPSVWYLRKEIRMVHEYLADSHVVKNSNVSSYSDLLARMTLSANSLTLGNYFNTTQTLNRLKMMNTQKRPTSKWKLGISFLVLATMFFTFACKVTDMPGIENQDVPPPPPPVEQNATNLPEEVAKPVDGWQKFSQEIAGKIIYPTSAKESKIEGRVYIGFTVTKNGVAKDFNLKKGIHPDCDKVAMEAIMSTDMKWIPGTKEGKPVAMEMVFPIQFAMD